jgi:hypothetical protein
LSTCFTEITLEVSFKPVAGCSKLAFEKIDLILANGEELKQSKNVVKYQSSSLQGSEGSKKPQRIKDKLNKSGSMS